MVISRSPGDTQTPPLSVTVVSDDSGLGAPIQRLHSLQRSDRLWTDSEYLMALQGSGLRPLLADFMVVLSEWLSFRTGG